MWAMFQNIDLPERIVRYSDLQNDNIVSLFPTIGLHAKHEEVSVNFGASPFTFDIQAYEEDALAEFEAAVSSCELPPLPLMNMVRQHLAFTGMHATLQALDKQVRLSCRNICRAAHAAANMPLKGSGLFGTDAVTDALAASANTRAMATSAIINGNCDSIMQFLEDLPPCCSAMVAVAVARFTQAYAAQPPLAPSQLLELAQSLFSPIMSDLMQLAISWNSSNIYSHILCMQNSDGELKEEDAALVTVLLLLLMSPPPPLLMFVADLYRPPCLPRPCCRTPRRAVASATRVQAPHCLSCQRCSYTFHSFWGQRSPSFGISNNRGARSNSGSSESAPRRLRGQGARV